MFQNFFESPCCANTGGATRLILMKPVGSLLKMVISMARADTAF